MVELIEFLWTTSLFNVIDWLAGMTLTDMMVVFLLSKPLFIIIALGAVFSGRKWGEAHYLQHRDCDRFLRESFSSIGDSDADDAPTCRPAPVPPRLERDPRR